MNSDLRELDERDPHALLGLQPGASQEEVTRAFRRNVVQGGHPDTGGNSDTFRQLTRARDILLDERRRTAYNATQQSPGAVGDDTPSTTQSERAWPMPPAQRGPDVPTIMPPLAVVTLLLALLGPFAWPIALVTGHLALRRIKRSGYRGHTFFYVAMAFLHVASFIAIPGLITFAVVSFAM